MMKRFAIAAGVACAGALVAAQAQQTPTFRSTTSLVLVDVTVLDNDGKPVQGLTADDFQVKLDGVPRQVRAVTYEQIAAPFDPESLVPDVGPVNPTGAPNRVQSVAIAPVGPETKRRIIVVLVDDLSLKASRGRDMLAAAARFVRELPKADLVGYMTTSGAAGLNPSTDHLAVELALPRVVGQFDDPRDWFGPPVGIDEGIRAADGDRGQMTDIILRDCLNGVDSNTAGPAIATIIAQVRAGNYDVVSGGTSGPAGQIIQCIEDTAKKARLLGRMSEGNAERQIQAFTDAVKALRNVPGLKQLVVISDGLVLPRRSSSAVALEPMAKAAAAAGVQISVLSQSAPLADVGDVDRSIAAVNMPPTVVEDVRRADDVALRQGVATMADMTGGTYQQVIGAADTAFRRVALSSSALYELGVEMPEKSVPGKDFALSVSLKNKRGYSLHANHHALVPEPKAPVPIDTQLKDAIGNGTPLFGIPMSVGSSVRKGTQLSQVTVNLDVQIPASIPGPLTLMFGLVDPIGVAQSGKRQIDVPAAGKDYRVTLAVPVAMGNYKMRLAVADATGAVGSVETKVRAVLAPMGPVLASDLLTGWSGDSGPTEFLALEQLPAAATKMYDVLELYSNGKDPLPADVRVNFTILTPDGTPVDDRDSIPRNVNGVLRAEAPFELQMIPAGAYTVRATVKVAGADVGTATTTVRLPGPGGHDGP
jgi:VWFA-related protein